MVKDVEIGEVIDKGRLGRFQIGVMVLCGLIAMADGFDTQAIGFVAPSLAQSLGVDVATFGPIFGAGLFGLTIGAFLFGPAADRYGRKKITILCTALFGLFALSTVWAWSYESLLVLRFLTGIGLGGVMPNIITITSEYSPSRLRATAVSIMFCGFPLGAILGGVIAARLMPIFGWEAVFYIGGIFPLLLVPVLMRWMPESIRYLAARPERAADTVRILGKIDPQLKLDDTVRIVSREEKSPGSPVVELFLNGRAFRTTLLWVIFFMNLLILYFLSNWLPTVLRNAGLPIERAIIATSLLYVGGMAGAVILARLIDRAGPFWVLGAAYAGAAVSIALLGNAGANANTAMLLVFLTGFCVIGAQISINALASSVYPTAIRSTGVGWALGIGRVGSIVGPVVGGVLMSAHLDIPSIFLVSAVPAAIAALCAVMLRFDRSARAVLATA